MPLTLNSSGVKTGHMKVDGTIEKKKFSQKQKKQNTDSVLTHLTEDVLFTVFCTGR